MYHVKATFTFVPIEKRSYGAPFDNALLRDVLVKPGEIIKAGQPLLVFDSTDAKLQKAQSMADANEAEQQALEYRADPTKTADMLQALDRAKSNQAKAAYWDDQIQRATIIAPFDGEVLTGDLTDKRGSTFKQGDPLLEFAKRENGTGDINLQAQIAVQERDIQDVHVNSPGSIATRRRAAGSSAGHHRTHRSRWRGSRLQQRIHGLRQARCRQPPMACRHARRSSHRRRSPFAGVAVDTPILRIRAYEVVDISATPWPLPL